MCQVHIKTRQHKSDINKYDTGRDLNSACRLRLDALLYVRPNLLGRKGPDSMDIAPQPSPVEPGQPAADHLAQLHQQAAPRSAEFSHWCPGARSTEF